MQVSMDGAAGAGTGQRRGSTSGGLKPAPVFKHPVTYHYAIQNHTTRMQKLTKAFQVYRLMAITLVCVVAGIIVGLLCRPHARHWTERKFMYIELPGELYLRFLKLMIIPLLVSNVILSFGTIQGKISSQLGKVAGFLYLSSNLIAITLAILVAMIISPGLSQRQARSRDPNNLIHNYNKVANHHYFHEYHDSIARYREYHPMFYHTNTHDDADVDGDDLGPQQPVNPRSQPPPPPSSLSSLPPHSQAEERRTVRLSIVSSALTNSPKKFLGDNRQLPQVDAGAAAAATNDSHHSDRDESQPQLVETTSELIDIEQQTTAHTNRIDLSSRDLGEELAQLVRSIERSQAKTANSQSIETPINRIGLSTKLPIDVILDVMRNLIPDSLVGASLQQSRTRLFTPREIRIERNGTTNPPPHTWQMGHEMVNQPNIVGLLAMSVLTGVVLSHMGEASKPLLDLCSCISELSLRIGMKAIHMAPICIMFLLIGQISRASDLSQIAGELCMYVITVLVALLLHAFLVLPLVYYLVTKKSPLRFFKGLVQALVAAFATSSSSATMALVLNCMSELDINLIIVRAFGPLGSVFNMNGTSIFEAVAVIFIAQTLDVRLPTTSLLLIGLCSAIASLSTSGIPSSGMMTMVIVLNAINLPVLELSLIYIVDFIIDRFRTVVNVWSGAVVCGLIDHICPEELFEEEMKPEKYLEMIKYRGSRTSLASRKASAVEDKPQVISVTITPPPPESSNI